MAKIIIGVTGGIAAYKSASVISVLVGQGHSVRVIMTEAAKQFVCPLTFSALSHNPVYGDHNRFANDGHIHHIELAEWADLMVIVPTTYNTIMKIVSGTTDNLLMSTYVPLKGMRKPVIVCPAMNTNMWAELESREILDGSLLRMKSIHEYFEKTGIHMIGPAEGKMACGSIGKGKLASTSDIIDGIHLILGNTKCQ